MSQPFSQHSGRCLPLFLALTLVLGPASIAGAETRPGAAAQALAAALKLHEDATDFSGEVAALDALRQAADTQPDDWRAAFWTSYVASQVARLVMRGQGEGDLKAYLATSRTYLDQARTHLGSDTGRDASRLHALEALLLRFYTRSSNDEKDSEHMTRSREALNAAVRADPENPVVLVSAGTTLVSDGRKDGDLSKVLGGLRLMQEAQRLFAADPRPRSQTTAFNSEWLPFWIPNAEKALQESTSP